ncbi:hypothetical protein PHLGIDRAFT_92109 [Phlebiopsis gigantea 11061_1 CR5-6]|uniref:RRM Nup35-type domain-containing protein n=1 Tax=Phlebiopsis gigantea (strain 11061_1 CR5-6) TaxID=745531 RepID=A0A0C3NKH7_PHLG1|nr:hypothetical protein PHLGIDRAFT_92109 [Phlebiopsis gigantea 11061_1 CR5-6]
MYSSTSYQSSNSGAYQGHDGSGFPHSRSQPFSVAGMQNQGVMHSPSLRSSALAGGSGLGVGGTLGDSLAQSRSHYQPGYLMSVTQNSASSQSPRYDDVPIIPTKAKMNHPLTGAAAADFGMDSMFESTRQRQTIADEDAPPMSSVNDIPTEVYDFSSSRRAQQTFSFDSTARASLFHPSQSQVPATPKSATPVAKPLYLIVFGYPPDRYSATIDYFRSLGDTTEPDPNVDITNCFRIGFRNPGEAMRAVRKNGEVLSGSWMIGVKWADPAQAEAVLGFSVRSPYASPPDVPSPPDVTMSPASPTRGFASNSGPDLTVSTLARSGAPIVGTPIKLAPSTAAFRKPGSGPASQLGIPRPGDGSAQPGGAQFSPSKSMLGQMSDLIFGW